jgi:alkylation response protein AidB-like acyl-CoA dehydrogenase
MDYRESEEQTMLRDTVRKFAQNEVKPVAVEYDKKVDPSECFPWELLKKASQLGLRTMAIPVEYGGAGVQDLISYIIVMEELGAADNGFGSCIRNNLAAEAWIDLLCSKEQKDEFFPKIIEDDEFTIGIGMSEPNSGTNNLLMADVPGGAMQTFCEKKGDEYIINGTKHFISNGGIAKLFLLHVTSNRKLSLNESRTVFLVPSNTPGFSIGSIHNKLGRRLLSNAELVFEDMRVPARYLVGKEGQAVKYLYRAAHLPFLVAATTLGTLRTCYQESLEYARIRIQGGKPIIEHQLIAAHLSEMRVRIEAARALLYKQAWCWQNQYEYDYKLTYLIRSFIDQVAGEIVFKMNDVFGGMGSDKDMTIEKLIRDVYTSLHGPTIGSALIRGAPDWKSEVGDVGW